MDEEGFENSNEVPKYFLIWQKHLKIISNGVNLIF